MNYINYSFDIETLGLKCTSGILSIGCCEFNILNGDIYREFYKIVYCGRFVDEFTVDESTIKWWENQSIKAREILTSDKKMTYQTV
jgi:hypothetical protein